MTLEKDANIIHKEVVVIGNGPSGITLSYMLSGNIPYLISNNHPDEMFSARLSGHVNESLINQDLQYLSTGLEGRTTNCISLLMDSLLHPYADMGYELEPLIEFRKTGKEIDHVVLGKGPPGGAWHKMDPYILTLSLGSWMSLPGMPFISRDSGEKRAFAHNVAKYYERYVQEMNLGKYFKNNCEAVKAVPIKNLDHIPRIIKRSNWVKSLDGDNVKICLDAGSDDRRSCFISNAFNCFLSKNQRKHKFSRCCKRPCERINEQSPSRKVREIEATPLSSNKTRSVSFSCDSNIACDRDSEKKDNFSMHNLRNSFSLDFSKTAPLRTSCQEDNWLVSCVDSETGEKSLFSCKYLVLANGANDLPNKLEVSRIRNDPEWLVHDLRSLEVLLDQKLKDEEDILPVLVVGAGLSAADAIIATRGRNIPVAHVFRNKSADLNKQLPENMYPEYHKVHQMMQDGGSSYPLYTSYPEYILSEIDEASRTVTLKSKSGECIKLQVSFAVVLIGSRPNLNFISANQSLGVNRTAPVDCKTNPIDIDKLTHKVKGYNDLFAIGPLAGDSFVRFIPGGALAVLSELYKRNNYIDL